MEAHWEAGVFTIAMPRIITLFSEAAPPRNGPSPFLVSIAAHGVALSLAYLGIRQTPRVYDPFLAKRYTVRYMELHREEPLMSGLVYPTSRTPALRTAGQASASGKSTPPQSSTSRIARSVPADQILMQPDAPPRQLTIPLPTVALWSIENSPAKKIVSPAPHEAATADASPTVEPPNREVKPGEMRISSTPFATEAPMPSPGTTSPLAARGEDPAKQLPETASKQDEPPTPAQVISISDLHARQGVVVLPSVNEAPAASSAGMPALGQSLTSAQARGADPDSSHSGIGSDQQSGAAENEQTASWRIAGQGGATSGSPRAADSGPGSSDSVTRITLKKDGRFGVVVVESSLEDEYPEMAGMWTGRMTYTVYLHVGLAKNWTLQYSLPRQLDAASAGANHLEAPWPYEMMRPNLSSAELNTDAVMVHGVVNKDGRFEEAAVVFPPQFAQTKFVLNALQDWHFRPATLNGQATPVEVLLIIPGEAE
jgi:hypothetical protein